VTLQEDGRKLVEIKEGSKIVSITVDTILVAIGRDCDPAGMNVDNAGVKYGLKSRKILGRAEEPERTSVDHIYAVGDIV
jgi:pyruvate/2-oxoglutarate dehydrogenase complex dihydrolipoamide dehydrogenase (E3) component